MRGYDLQRALEALGMSQRKAAEFLAHDERTIRRYVADELPVPVVVARLLRTMVKFGISPDDVPEA